MLGTPSLNSSGSFFTPSNNTIVEGVKTCKGLKIGSVDEVYKDNRIDFNDIGDMFTISSVRDRMKIEEANVLEIEKFIKKCDLEGDVHYFKKQTFGPAYSRMNSKGKLIPQAQFDEDPITFFKDNMNHFEIEYLGLEEDYLIRKGEKKGDFHKILVKGPLIRKLLDEYWKSDPKYVPKSGHVLSYQKFYALICSGGISIKKELALERESKSKARNNTLSELTAMEEEAINNVNNSSDNEKKQIEEKLTKIDEESVSADNVPEYDKFTNLKKSYLFRIAEIDKERIRRRNEIVEFYNKVRKMKEDMIAAKASVQTIRNERKRQKRSSDKQSTLEYKNGTLVIQKPSSAAEEEVQDKEGNNELEETFVVEELVNSEVEIEV